MNQDKTKDIESGHLIPDTAPELLRGPQCLRDLRRRSRDAFNEAPVPPRGLHLWRYTDPTRFLVNRDIVADTTYGENYETVRSILLEQVKEKHLAALVTDLSGRQIQIHGAEELDKQGVILCRLSEAVEKHHELVEQYLYQLVNNDTGKFEALNGALWNDGIFIYVPDGKTVEKPLHLLREAGLGNSAQYPRLLVIVGRNSELTLIDEYGGGGDRDQGGPSHSNSAVEIFGLRDSRTRYVSLQRQASAMHSYLTHRARIDEGANILTIPLAFGGEISKENFGVTLAGKGAESNMYGLLFGSDRQHFDNHTLHHHASGQTLSNIDFKVVLRDKALSAYTGLIRIENDAKTCEAYQENRNLLLNPGTKAETIPELEILNEDVSCSHGATIGPIDPMSIFYLKARGIEETEAVRMIVAGFVQSTLKILPENLRDRINDFVNQRLEHI